MIDSVSEFAGRGSEESGFDLAMRAGEVNLRVESRRHSENEAKGEREYMFHRRFTALSALRLSVMGGAWAPACVKKAISSVARRAGGRTLMRHVPSGDLR